MSAAPEHYKPDHALTSETSKSTSDRPADGALRPRNGTISAPVLVVGATGTIGRLIVGNLVAAGRPVVAVAPDRGRLDGLRAAHPEGLVVPSNRRVLTDEDAAELAAMLRALDRPLAGVVVAIATHTRRARMLDRPADDLRECLDRTLLPQLALARHLIPLLAESGRNGSYVMIGRPGSEAPWAGYGHHSVAMAAVRMLAHALHEEARPLGVRMHLLSVDSPVRGAQPGAHDCPEWPSATAIARRVHELIERANPHEPARAIVTCGRSAATPANPVRRQRRFPDVLTFIQSLKTQHHEVFRDDTP